MQRYLLGLLVLCSLDTGTLHADEPTLTSRIGNIQIAVEHLEEARMDRAAKELRSYIPTLLQERETYLDQKQVELHKLQAEISELRTQLKLEHPRHQPAPQVRVLPQPRLLQSQLPHIQGALSLQSNGEKPSYEIHCLIAEMNPAGAKSIEAFAKAHSQKTTASPVLQSFVVSKSELETIQCDIEENMMVMSQPTVRVQAGMDASVQIGKEVPIILPVSNEQHDTKAEIIHDGIRLEMKALPVDSNRISLTVAGEKSSVDFTHAAQFKGQKVPGRTVSRFNVDVEMQPGEILVLLQRTSKKEGSILYTITPEQLPTEDAK